AAADRHLHDSGVFYRVYEDASGVERPWPLSHVPLLINEEEWQTLKAGLIQRAELLETVLADVYGPANLVRDGKLPAVLIAGNPEFLRPLVGVAPRGSAHLRFYAVDIGRSPDGNWWVLRDRTQAPSGSGYALENRLALSRALPDVYRALKVERLAPFFQAFQAGLSALNRHDEARVCLLTPGSMNETYFEHASLSVGPHRSASRRSAAARWRPLVGVRADRNRTRCANPHRRRRGATDRGLLGSSIADVTSKPAGASTAVRSSCAFVLRRQLRRTLFGMLLRPL